MKENGQPGLMEHTRSAVQPLAEDGEFHLSYIQYEFDHGGIAVRLCSKKMDIEFRGALRVSSDFISIFNVHSEKKKFIGDYLFPALHLGIQPRLGEPVGHLDLNVSKDTPNRKLKIHTIVLYSERVFLLELNRLCNEIQKNLPEIHTAFSPEKMEETIREYSIEARKDRPQGRIF